MSKILTKNYPVLFNHDFGKHVGWIKFNKKYLPEINENSVFSLGYILKKDKFELIEISLTNDTNYKEFLDKKYKI